MPMKHRCPLCGAVYFLLVKKVYPRCQIYPLHSLHYMFENNHFRWKQRERNVLVFLNQKVKKFLNHCCSLLLRVEIAVLNRDFDLVISAQFNTIFVYDLWIVSSFRPAGVCYKPCYWRGKCDISKSQSKS